MKSHRVPSARAFEQPAHLVPPLRRARYGRTRGIAVISLFEGLAHARPALGRLIVKRRHRLLGRYAEGRRRVPSRRGKASVAARTSRNSFRAHVLPPHPSRDKRTLRRRHRADGAGAEIEKVATALRLARIRWRARAARALAAPEHPAAGAGDAPAQYARRCKGSRRGAAPPSRRRVRRCCCTSSSTIAGRHRRGGRRGTAANPSQKRIRVAGRRRLPSAAPPPPPLRLRSARSSGVRRRRSGRRRCFGRVLVVARR